MNSALTPVVVTEEQVHYFRARRGHLCGPGAADAATAARSLIGAQSQQLSSGLLGLSQRTRGRPDREQMTAMLLAPGRTLVRTWGQRDTLHIYHPRDWPMIVAVHGHWIPTGRRGLLPSRTARESARQALVRAGGLLKRSDLFDLAPREFVHQAEEQVGEGIAALRFAAGRLFWSLALRGEVCLANKVGSEQVYALREHWFPDLEWVSLSPSEAGSQLTERYLATYGPATSDDIGHYFGARRTAVRRWLRHLRDSGRLVEIECGQRPGLVLLRQDLDHLAVAPPGRREWPVRMLPLWDGLLMGHADKSWLVPESSQRRKVWRPAAVVAATVLDRGRIVATWSRQVVRRRLQISVTPLHLWRQRDHLPGVRREARSMARYWRLEGADVVASN